MFTLSVTIFFKKNPKFFKGVRRKCTLKVDVLISNQPTERFPKSLIKCVSLTATEFIFTLTTRGLVVGAPSVQ